MPTPNLSFLIGCLFDHGFRDSVINSDLGIADGMPHWYGCHTILVMPIRERVSGSGVFESVRRDPAQRMSVCFFGGPEGGAERARQKLNAEGSLALAFHEEPR